MARWIEPSMKQKKGWRKWCASRPPGVRELAKRFPPWELYRLKTTGQRVTVASYYENGTLRVNVPSEYNMVLFEASVFGIDPNDLEPCDIPSPGEPTGCMLSHEEAEENIDAIRVMVRPDLFVMGEDGKATRKS
jgi:hypothetical protein